LAVCTDTQRFYIQKNLKKIQKNVWRVKLGCGVTLLSTVKKFGTKQIGEIKDIKIFTIQNFIHIKI